MEARRVRIERIADPKLREVVFRRRKNGLLRRAMELSVMADCDVAVLVFHGTTGQLTQYSSAPIGGMLQRFARACTRPHETYTNEDLYTHHVLAQMAADAEEADGRSKRARTLPSFWAAKAALERQRQREGRAAAAAAAQRHAAAEGGGEGCGEGGEAAVRAAKRRRTEGDGGEEEEGSGGDESALSDYSDLDRQAAALAELAESAGAALTPRSRRACERISREFDRLMARAREEFETAEALAAVPLEPEGPDAKEEAGEEVGGAPAHSAQQQQQEEAAAAAAAARAGPAPAGDAAAASEERLQGAPAAAAATGSTQQQGGSPQLGVASPLKSREAPHPAGSLTQLLQQPSPSGVTLRQNGAAAGAAAASGALPTPSMPAAGSGTLPSLAAGGQPATAGSPTVVGVAAPPAGSATVPPQLHPPPVHPLQARLQLQAFPRGTSYVLRPVTVPAPPGGGGGGGGVPGQAPPGMMLQLQPVAMQPAQLQQYQHLIRLQQQQLVAAATKQARMQAAHAAAAGAAARAAAPPAAPAGLPAVPARPVAAPPPPQQRPGAAGLPRVGPPAQPTQAQYEDLVLPIVSAPQPPRGRTRGGVQQQQAAAAAAAAVAAGGEGRDPVADMLA